MYVASPTKTSGTTSWWLPYAVIGITFLLLGLLVGFLLFYPHQPPPSFADRIVARLHGTYTRPYGSYYREARRCFNYREARPAPCPHT